MAVDSLKSLKCRRRMKLLKEQYHPAFQSFLNYPRRIVQDNIESLPDDAGSEGKVVSDVSIMSAGITLYDPVTLIVKAGRVVDTGRHASCETPPYP